MKFLLAFIAVCCWCTPGVIPTPDCPTCVPACSPCVLTNPTLYTVSWASALCASSMTFISSDCTATTQDGCDGFFAITIGKDDIGQGTNWYVKFAWDGGCYDYFLRDCATGIYGPYAESFLYDNCPGGVGLVEVN